MTKKFPVVMLPTEKVSNLYIQNNKLCYDKTIVESIKDCGDQNLYILSDEEIKEGDWFVDMNGNPRQADIKITEGLIIKGDKKIVATTNKHLRIGGGTGKRQDGISILLPQIPESFIQDYIKAYNEGNPIVEVELEMIKCCGRCIDGIDECQGDVIKTTPDNKVIVHQSKMYTRHEVIKLIEKFDDSIPHNTDVDKWIQDNL